MGSTSVETPTYQTGMTQSEGGVFIPPERLSVVKIIEVNETVTEGTDVLVDIVRSNVETTACAVKWTLADTAGKAGFLPPFIGVATIDPGVLIVRLALPTDPNVGISDGNRTVMVYLSEPVGCVIDPTKSSASIIITDQLTVSVSVALIGPLSIPEGNVGGTVVTFRITKTGGPLACSVGWTRDGTMEDNDFVPGFGPNSGTATFTSAQTTVDLPFTIQGDTDVGPNETLIINLRAPVNCSIVNGSATLTVVDDDMATPTGWPYPQSNLYTRLNFNQALTRYGQESDQWPCSEDASNRMLWVGADGNGFGSNGKGGSVATTGVPRTEWRVSRHGSAIPNASGAGLSSFADLALRMREQSTSSGGEGDPADFPTNSKPLGILAFNTNHILVYYQFLGTQPSEYNNWATQTHCALSTDNGSTFNLNRALGEFIFRQGKNEDLVVWGVLQLGAGYTAGTSGIDTNYIYVYLGNDPQRQVLDYAAGNGNQTMWLARVKWAGGTDTVSNILNPARYQMFTGLNASGVPTWGTAGSFGTKTRVYFDTNGMGLFFNVYWHSAISKFVATYIHAGIGTATQGIAVAISDSPWDQTKWQMIGYARDLDNAASDEEDWYLSCMAPSRWNDGTTMRFGFSTYVEGAGGGSGDNLIVTSAALTAPSAVPANTALPVITGTVAVGRVLNCSTGTWNNSPTSYYYVWRTEDGVAFFEGTSAFNVTLAEAQLYRRIFCSVTAANASGSTFVNTSQTIPVAPATGAPLNSTLPVITGNTIVGQTLNCSTGTWTNSPTSYYYVWWDSNTGPFAEGATLNSVVVTSDRVGHNIFCAVTARNAAGANYISSATVGPVTEGNTRPYPMPGVPEDVRASYGGTLYYVAPDQTGGPSTSISSPGGLEQTIEGLNDNNRIVAAPGDYGGMTITCKSGQAGKLLVYPQNPVFNSLNLSDYDGGMVGYDRTASHSYFTGLVNFINFKQLYFEGFRFGPADERYSNDATTNGKIQVYGDITNSGMNWIVKNYFKNCVSTAILVNHKQRAMCFQNYFMGNKRVDNFHDNGDFRVTDWAMDYFIRFQEELWEGWAIENFFDYGFNQGISYKQKCGRCETHGNVFNASVMVPPPPGSPGAASSGGSAIIIGQQSDETSGANKEDNTCGSVGVSYNKIKRLDGVVNIHVSNVVDADCHHNEHASEYGTGSGLVAAYRLYTDDSNSSASLYGPLHPKLWKIHHDNFVDPSRLRFQFGRSRVKESVQRHNIDIRDNIAPSNVASTFSETDNQGGFPSGLDSGMPDYDPNARMLVTFGTNAKVSVPPGNNSETDIQVA